MKTYTLIIGDEHGLRGSDPRESPLTADTISDMRESFGLSRNKLALLAGCSAVYIAKIERGERRLTIDMKRTLMRIFEELEEQARA